MTVFAKRARLRVIVPAAVMLLVGAGAAAAAPGSSAVTSAATASAASASATITAPTEVDADRFMALTSELRCLVCQNESLADSNAPLALDLKREIRARMAAGDSNAQILDFLVQRYGDFVTYRPPVNARTGLLWLGPALLLGVGGWVVWRQTRRGGPSGSSDRSAT